MNKNGEGNLDRRQFLERLGVMCVGAGFLALAGTGCESGGGDGGTDAPPTTTTPGSSYSDKSASIGSNHGHSATLTAAQQQAGDAVMLGLSSGDGHTHTVSFSAGQVQTIAAGGSATSESSTDGGHSHSVTFS